MSSPYPVYGDPYSGPDGNLYPHDASATTLGDPSTVDFHTRKAEDDARRVSRTPSPTPSEQKELARDGLFDWKTLLNWRFWIRREWLCA